MRRLAALNEPVASVATVVRVPDGTWTTVTRAPGIALPASSVTSPRMVPVTSCASTVTAGQPRASKATPAFRLETANETDARLHIGHAPQGHQGPGHLALAPPAMACHRDATMTDRGTAPPAGAPVAAVQQPSGTVVGGDGFEPPAFPV